MDRTLGKTSLHLLHSLGRLLQPAQAISHLPLISLSIGLLAWIVSAAPVAEGLLQYDREALAAGETWRILTGHLTHWNAEHLLWDVMVFVALGAACERLARKNYVLCLALGAPVISLSVWAALPEM